MCFAATSVSLQPEAKVFDLVARAWAGFGSTLAPVLLIALYQKNASGLGALFGLITGAAIVLIWPFLPHSGFGIYEILPGFLSSILVNYVANNFIAAEESPIGWH